MTKKNQLSGTEGYMKDSQGRFVPLDLVEPIDLERDKLVRGILQDASSVQGVMSTFRNESTNAINKFVEKAAKKKVT